MIKTGVFIRALLLLIPLIWYVDIWLGVFFGIKGSDIGMSEDIIPDFIAFLIVFIGTPLSFIVGVFYTWIKKHWIWLAAYILLGGIPIFIYLFDIFSSSR